MSPQVTSNSEAVTVKKTSAKKGSPAKSKAKSPKTKTKGETKKKDKKGVGYLARGMTAQEYQAERAKKSICWSERRIALVKALRALKATTIANSQPADVLAKKLKVDEKVVKIHCDAYRGNELVAHGFVMSARIEGSRQLHYYLTPAGIKTNFS